MKNFLIALALTSTSAFAATAGAGLGTSTTGPFNPAGGIAQPKKVMVNYKNPANKFDALGALHNEAMDYVRKQVKVGAPISEVFKALDTFFVSKKIKFSTTTEEFFSRGLKGFLGNLMKTDDAAGFLYSNAHFSKGASVTYPVIVEKCMNGYDKGDQSDLIKFENEKISRDPSTSTGEKEALLVSAAICRYSTEYSFRNLMNNSTPDAAGTGPQNKSGKDIGKADVNGAITGAAGGALGGSVTVPGVGTVAGWVAGGVVGACAGSAAEWITSWW